MQQNELMSYGETIIYNFTMITYTLKSVTDSRQQMRSYLQQRRELLETELRLILAHVANAES